MTRKTYGLIAGLFAAAGVGMWWWRTRGIGYTSADIGRGRLIFDNTPTASTPDGNI